MFEGTVSMVPSIWASVNSWFTPAVLFVLLNLCIATIAVTSGVGAARKPPPKHPKTHNNNNNSPQTPLPRSPSLLHRLKSINLYAYKTPEPPVAAPTTTIFAAAAAKPPTEIETHFAPDRAEEEEEVEEVEEEEEEEDEEEGGEGEEESVVEQSMDEVFGMIQGRRGAVSRVKSDTRPMAGEIPVRLPRKMRKSASAKSAFAHFEADDAVESRRPATAREQSGGEGAADHEVDAKADDFINRFRQQLQLQRLDSIMRYKEMLKRGSDTNDVERGGGCGGDDDPVADSDVTEMPVDIRFRASGRDGHFSQFNGS